MKAMTVAEIHAKVAQWQIKGFLADDEAASLWQWARELAHLGPCLEIGSYCGKSTIYLAEGCRHAGGVVYALDHHRGSEEHQLGEAYHDHELYDELRKTMDSFPALRQNLALFSLTESVIPIVCTSALAVQHWATPLSLVFVDGGHAPEVAMHDCLEWSKYIVRNGILAVHDIFENPEEGGQGPFLAVEELLRTGGFEWIEKVRSLGILRRL